MKGKLLSRVRLFATPWTPAYQAPLSMGFSRQEYWSGVPLPSPFDHAILIECDRNYSLSFCPLEMTIKYVSIILFLNSFLLQCFYLFFLVFLRICISLLIKNIFSYILSTLSIRSLSILINIDFKPCFDNCSILVISGSDDCSVYSKYVFAF